MQGGETALPLHGTSLNRRVESCVEWACRGAGVVVIHAVERSQTAGKKKGHDANPQEHAVAPTTNPNQNQLAVRRRGGLHRCRNAPDQAEASAQRSGIQHAQNRSRRMSCSIGESLKWRRGFADVAWFEFATLDHAKQFGYRRRCGRRFAKVWLVTTPCAGLLSLNCPICCCRGFV